MVKADAHAAYARREQELTPEVHARGGASRRALGAGPQVARAPVRDGLPARGRQPARLRPARPADRVSARGLRHVHRDDGRASRKRLGQQPVQPAGAGAGEPDRVRGRRGGPGSGRPGDQPGPAPRSAASPPVRTAGARRGAATAAPAAAGRQPARHRQPARRAASRAGRGDRRAGLPAGLARGLARPQRSGNLSYSAPSEDASGRAQHTTGSASSTSYANVGRNAPCPCGSGRKFKQCHGDPRNR